VFANKSSALANHQDDIMSATMDTTFGDWLMDKLNQKDWSQADLARRSGVSRTSISDIISGRRQVGKDLAVSVSEALALPLEEVFRAAGLLPSRPDSDEIVDRINYLYHSLRDPANKQKALEYFEFLRTSEDKGDYRVAQPSKKREKA